MRQFLWLCMLVLTSAGPVWSAAPAQSGAAPLKLVRVTPSGDDVPAGRQIVLVFHRPVVPIGRMERRADELPITMTPQLACAWRWLDRTSLACQLDEQASMTPATRYTITIRPGITTAEGATLAAAVTHTFTTQRPKVTRHAFVTWKAPGVPEILVVFNQPVRRESVAQHLFLSTDQNKRLAVGVQVAEDHRGRGWLIRPSTDLPADTQVKLQVEPGIVSTQGPEPSVEQRTIVAFATFPPVRFLGVQCVANTDEEQLLTIAPTPTPGQTSPQKLCKPLRGISLLFSAPVRREAIKSLVRLTPALTLGRLAGDPWEEVSDDADLSRPHTKGNTYEVQLPGSLRPYTTYRLHAPPQQIKDVFGRVMVWGVALQFATDHRLPEYSLNHPVSVLEQQVDTHIPLEVANLESVQVQYDTLTAQGRQTTQQQTIPLRHLPQDVGYTVPLNVRALIPARSGAIQGTLSATPVMSRDTEPRWFFSQVTPFHVHVKLGHHNTLVWVTRFDTGLPVAGVHVRLTAEPERGLTAQPKVLAEATTNADGVAMVGGTLTLDPGLQLLDAEAGNAPRLFVRLHKDDDMALVPLTNDFQVDYRNLAARYGHLRAWGMTPQGVYRAGDTVAYKLYVRDQSNAQFIAAPQHTYTLQVFDPTDKVVHTVKRVRLSDFGAYDGEFAVPQNGAVGWYRFELSTTFAQDTAGKEYKLEPMRVLISDFTPASFRVTADLHTPLVTAGTPVTVSTQAALHAGGPYSEAETRVTAAVHSTPLVPDDPQWAGFVFTTLGPPAQNAPATPQPTAETAPEGISDDTDPTEGEDAGDVDSVEATASETVYQTEAKLNAQGALDTTFPLPTSRVWYGQLRLESAVRDDRGKYVAGYTTARYAGRDRYVGLRQDAWVLQASTAAPTQVLVVNEHGKPVPGATVDVKVTQLHTQAARVKSGGNAYLPRYIYRWVDVETCTLVAQDTPVVCTFTPRTPGTYKITATLVDTQGRTHSTSLLRWAVGAGEVLWSTTPDHRLKVVPEKTTYAIGDTARYLVQNPFPGAKALITVERFGVQRSWVETLRDSTALIEVPITPEQLPGFYLSVLVMSPRVDKPLAEQQVDLGKPMFRLGYARTLVRDPHKALQVTVRPREAVYKPRQTATIDLHVTPRQDDTPPIELAVAVLDEAVFDLIAGGKNYFDPYAGFYTLEALDLRNYNLLTQLIGRQKFDKKGANPGGDGGIDLDLRSVFKFVSYWHPTLRPDATGKATISFELPDNLTGWRVLALAVTPTDRMGLGEGHFKVNKATEIRPALPNQVTAGDRFEASFTIMNRTDATRTLDVTLSAKGPITATASMRQRLEATPFTRYHIRLPLETTHDGEITLQAQVGDAQDHDALTLPLPVHKRQALEVVAAYSTSTGQAVQETIAFPAAIRTDVGHVEVTAAPTVLGGLDGAFRYMRDYPYLCWEQRLTKGVMAAHYHSLKDYLPATLHWEDSATLPTQTLSLAANYQAPNGGMTYYLPKDEYVSPDLSAYTALAFNWLRAAGYPIPAPVETKLHEYLLRFLRRDAAPDFYSRGMSATVRALALAALAPHGHIGPVDVPRYHMHVKDMSLFGKAHYLLALTALPDTAALQTAVLELIRAQANETSGTLAFSEETDAGHRRLLDSAARTHCAVLSALLAYGKTHPGADEVGEAPSKLTRTITQMRKQRNRWESTQENIFCLAALADYSRVYEADKPQVTVRAALGATTLGTATLQDVKDAAITWQRPLQADDPGTQATLTLSREGPGRLYYTTRLAYAPATLRTEPAHAGVQVQREYSVERGRTWLLLQDPMTIKAGELVRVDLYLSLPAARHFVVVDDPIPGGLEPVQRDLATASTTDATKAAAPYAEGSLWYRHHDWGEFGQTRWSFYHKELRHSAARFYSEYLPPGRYHLSYVAQAIATGVFTVLPTHAEEMYHPETFGQSAPGILHIVPEGPKAVRQ